MICSPRAAWRNQLLTEKYGCDPSKLEIFPIPNQPRTENFARWLLAKIDYVPRDISLFITALCPHGATAAHRKQFQRLEFLGDAIANLYVTDITGRGAGAIHPQPRIHKFGPPVISTLSSNHVFGRASKKSGLPEFVPSRSNVEELPEGQRADLLESVAAAMFLDSGSIRTSFIYLAQVLREVDTVRKLLEAGGTSNEKQSKFVASDYFFLGKKIHRLLTTEAVFRLQPDLGEGDLSVLATSHAHQALMRIAAETGSSFRRKSFLLSIGQNAVTQGFDRLRIKLLPLYCPLWEPPPSDASFGSSLRISRNDDSKTKCA